MISFGLALSLHFLPGEWNSVHPMVWLEHEGWSAGLMLNSEEQLSIIGGYTFTQDKFWAELGLATGYNAAPVVPWFRAGYGPVFVLPGLTENGDVGLVVGLQFLMGE